MASAVGQNARFLFRIFPPGGIREAAPKRAWKKKKKKKIKKKEIKKRKKKDRNRCLIRPLIESLLSVSPIALPPPPSRIPPNRISRRVFSESRRFARPRSCGFRSRERTTRTDGMMRDYKGDRKREKKLLRETFRSIIRCQKLSNYGA